MSLIPLSKVRSIFFIIVMSFSVWNAVVLAKPPLTLSLNEAILLAVRDNPDVQMAELDQVKAKYRVEIEHWKFHPHFSFNATKTTSTNYSVTENGQVTQNSTAITPGVTMNSVIGTTASLTSTNDFQNRYYPGLTLEVAQPLLRGFGRAVVEQALYNALDEEKTSAMRHENTLRKTVTAVINAYLDALSAEDKLRVDQEALVRAKKSLQQTKLFIRAGQKAGTELMTQAAGIASNETTIESDKNTIEQSRYALLQAIGLDPNTPIVFSTINPLSLIKKYHVPLLEESKKIMLEHDIQYKIDQMTLSGSLERSLLAAEDKQRWELDLKGSVHAGGTGSNQSGINSLVNGVNQTDTVSLSLTIPIDDRDAKVAVEEQKIALHEAHMNLKKLKWENETRVINSWHNIYSKERALRLSQNAEALQKKSYNINIQKYAYGLINSIELQREQEQLMSRQQELVGSEISYLKSLVDFDELMGSTLQTWNLAIKK